MALGDQPVFDVPPLLEVRRHIEAPAAPLVAKNHGVVVGSNHSANLYRLRQLCCFALHDGRKPRTMSPSSFLNASAIAIAMTVSGSATSATISWHERPDGGRVRVWHWAPDGEQSRGRLLILPAYLQYGAYHGAYAASLAEEGFDVYVMDLRGYGSIHFDGSIRDATPLLQDAEFMLDHLCTSPGDLPVLLGYGTGGLIALELSRAATVPFRALVLVSPSIRFKYAESSFELGLQLLARQHPNVVIPPRFPDPLNNKPEVLKAWLEDPEVNFKSTAGELFAHQELQRRVARSVVIPRVPVLAIEGGADGFSDTAITAKWWSRMREAGVELTHHCVLGANNAVYADAPEAFLRHLRDYLFMLPR